MKSIAYVSVIALLSVVFGISQAGLATCEEVAIEQLTSGDVNNSGIQVSGAHAAWQGKDPNGGDWEIYYYDGSVVNKLTDNDTNDTRPDIRDSKVVWQGRDTNEGDWEIFFYHRGCIQQITNNAYDDKAPSISASRIFWRGWDGSSWQVFSAAIPVHVTMKVTPQTINLKSKGQWITVSLWMGNSLEAENVVISSLYLLDKVPASRVWINEDSDKLLIKFDRTAVQALLQPGKSVAITLTGRMENGTVFTASDNVKVISPGK